MELPAALGRGLAEDLCARESVPRFENSAMDGYAVRRSDVLAATEPSPVALRVVGEVAGGSAARPVVTAGTAVRVMTGAPIPEGADAVVPVEATVGGPEVVRVLRAPLPGAHIRAAGEDVRAGDLVVPAGTELGPRQLGLAAATGHRAVVVHRRPRVAVLSTGAELLAPGAALGPGQVPESNSYLLAAAAEQAGADVTGVAVVSDDPGEFRAALAELAGPNDAIITSGGISAGAYDVVRLTLAAWDTAWFGPVAMQPGKPQGFGRVGDTLLFALPGNPVSAFVSFQVFVRPALRRLRGLTGVHPAQMRASAAEGWTSPPGRRQFVPATVEVSAAGQLWARPVVAGAAGSGAHRVGALARADALAVVAEPVTAVRLGDPVEVVLLR